MCVFEGHRVWVLADGEVDVGVDEFSASHILERILFPFVSSSGASGVDVVDHGGGF